MEGKNLKIIYFAFVSSQYGGVEQKIIAQFDALRLVNQDTYLCLISKLKPDKTLETVIKNRVNANLILNSDEHHKNFWIRRKEKFGMISSVLKKYDPANTIVYLRFPLADWHFLRFLQRNSEYIIVTEHQDIENRLKIGLLRKEFIQDISDCFIGRSVRNRITGFVGVTSQITEFERSYVSDRNHFFKTIGNGIEIQSIPLRTPILEDYINELRILFVGSGFPAHGLSRLLRSISIFNNKQNRPFQVSLKIVGDSSAMNRNRSIARKLNLSSEVTFLGHLEGEHMKEVFDWAHIGCGSLGIHKKGLYYTSELKAREYCARGLPFFWSTSDDDFPQNFPYILNLQVGNATFDLELIFQFVQSYIKDSAHHIKMRRYAIENLDWAIKISELNLLFERIMNSK